METPPENWDKELTMVNKPNDTLLSAKIKVNGHLVQVLIDTGAQRTIITKQLLQKLQNDGARFEQYTPTEKLMQAASPLESNIGIVANLQIGKDHKKVKIPVTSSGFIQMILGLPELREYTVNLKREVLITPKEIIPLQKIGNKSAINYVSITTKIVNGITNEQMHNLLSDYYDGELKRDPFIRTEEYRSITNKEKKGWSDDKLNQHKKWLLRAYQRPHSRPIDELFIERLWKLRKRAEPYRQDRDDKSNFYGWIRGIFNEPVQIRTGKFHWENKELPPTPKGNELSKEQELLDKILKAQGTAQQTSNQIVQPQSQIMDQPSNLQQSLQTEYDQVKKMMEHDLREIYPKFTKSKYLEKLIMKQKLME